MINPKLTAVDMLASVCESDKQKLKSKVVQELQFYFKLSENEAANIWDLGVQNNLLVRINHWETDERFFYFSYEGKS